MLLNPPRSCGESNCADELDRGSAGLKAGADAPPPSAADGLDPVRSPVSMSTMRSVTDRARQECARSVHCKACGIPFFAARDHDVEDHDQLSHAGNHRDLLQLSSCQQALIKLLEHGIVLRGGPETRHVEGVSHLASPALGFGEDHG